MRPSLARSHPFRFVFIMSIVSLFADMTYEGARSVSGPFLASLGATGLVVGVVAGFGELAGFGLRYFSGTLADRTGRYWVAAFTGYVINMLSVPALALARGWPAAAALIVTERIGRGVRKPVADAMVSYAGSQLGRGWVFGFRQAMDQTGATIGPLLIALVLYLHGGFGRAFAILIVPALLSLLALTVAQRQFPTPRDLERPPERAPVSQQRAFWIYVAAGSCLAAGFADFALVSYHLSKSHVLPNHVIPVLYACAMLVAAVCAPVCGRAYDRWGIGVVAATFGLAALFAPLVFLGSPWAAITGVLLWGLGMGAQDALLPSIISRLSPPERRASALGTFDGVYGIAWFAGSATMGALYDKSILALVIFSLALQIIVAVPLLFLAASRETAERPG
ncbi:MAG: MFS transporter [Vulcanimicrobiaceae bacterium]